MDIIQKYDKDSTKPYQASMQWKTTDGHGATTYGVSDHSFAEAIGNMIIQMSASKEHPLTLSLVNDKGKKVTQKKL